MRHPHGLRAAAGNSRLPAIGEAFEGGFYAGLISHTANSIATHALIVAPRATGASGTGYTLTTNYALKTVETTTTGASSTFDGAANTAAMVTAGIAAHPAANFCVGLSVGGYSDWYLPARYELDIAYQNLKPSTVSNNTSWGINPYSVPELTVNRTAGAPTQTSVAAFQTGGSQVFNGSNTWASGEESGSIGWSILFIDGTQAFEIKTNLRLVRAFRKIAI